MKILVLQLARLGDIFQTWPALHALRRQGAEIHVLVRPRFRSAAERCDAIQKIYDFETDTILSPVLEDPRRGLQPSLEAIDNLMQKLDHEKYDRVVNLSFSPLSSWLTFDLEMRAFQRGKTIACAGYTRHIDGALAIPDDASAYFFAQVGYRVQSGSTEPVNRLSISRLFATIAGVDPIEADWRGPSELLPLGGDIRLPVDFVCVHIGASDEAKTLDACAWGEVVARIVRRTEMPVVLLGAAEEMTKAAEIISEVELNGVSLNHEGRLTNRVLSLVGKTKVSELFEIVREAKLLIAGDSALVQVASLVGTRVLNLSSRTVSHWETGPATRGSRILLYGGAAPAAETIVREAENMIFEVARERNGSNEISNFVSQADRVVAGPIEPITEHTKDGYADFMWQLISAIYLGTKVPRNNDEHLQAVLVQWSEVQNIENHQLNSLRENKGDPRQIAEILNRIDQVTGLIVESEPRLGPIERWWSTERVRLGPQTQESLTDKYLVLNAQLESVLLSLREFEERHDGQQLDL